MTLRVTHNFVSPVSDELEADKVGPDEWNANHVIAGDLAGLNTATGNVTLYVATTGSDSNDGSIGSPFLTIQKALLVAASYDYQATYEPTIHIAAGEYSISNSLLLPELVNLATSGQGNIVGASHTTTTIFDANSSIAVTASGVDSRWGISAICVDSPRACIYADHNALIGLTGTVRLADRANGGTEFFNAFHGGRINISTATVDITSNAFAAFFLGGGNDASFNATLATINLPSGSYGVPGTNFFLFTDTNGLCNITWTLNTVNNAASYVGSQFKLGTSGGTVLYIENGDTSLIPGSTTGNQVDNEVQISKYVGSNITNRLMVQFSGVPGTSTIPAGSWGVYKDTSGGSVKIYCNDGGVIKSVALT